MNNRVRILRNKLNMSQSAFGKRLGVTGAGISKIESGKRKLTEQMLLMMCKEFNINEYWLRNGEGEIFRQKYPNDLEQLAQYYILDELDKKIIYEYARLKENERRVIKDYIMRLACSKEDNLLRDTDNPTEVQRCAERYEDF